jgi:hypothetical protein
MDYATLQSKSNSPFLAQHGPTYVHDGHTGSCWGTLEEFARKDKGRTWLKSGGSYFRYGIEGGEVCILQGITDTTLAILDYVQADKWYFNQIQGLGLLKQALAKIDQSTDLTSIALAQNITSFLANFEKETTLGE